MRSALQLTDAVHIAYGKDHAVGYFVQLYDNGTHETTCECLQCECDMPVIDAEYLTGWHGVIDLVRKETGFDITGHIVGVGPDKMIVAPEQARLVAERGLGANTEVV